MKANLVALFVLLISVSTHSFAQTTAHAQLYFLNSGSGHTISLAGTERKANGNKPITVPSRTCAVVDLVSDSLSIAVNGGSQSLYFAPGEMHYFIGVSDSYSGIQLTEVTDRVFWLSATINKSKSITRYSVDKISN